MLGENNEWGVVVENTDEALYEGIKKRVDIMFDLGLEDEARNIMCGGRNISRTAAQAIGYKEFLPYFNGEKSISEVSADIKLATRHYAKRQIIWFRRYSDAVRLVPDSEGFVKSAKELADEAILYIVSNR